MVSPVCLSCQLECFFLIIGTGPYRVVVCMETCWVERSLIKREKENLDGSLILEYEQKGQAW